MAKPDYSICKFIVKGAVVERGRRWQMRATFRTEASANKMLHRELKGTKRGSWAEVIRLCPDKKKHRLTECSVVTKQGRVECDYKNIRVRGLRRASRKR